jgi:pyroglutamyl-peptidase
MKTLLLTGFGPFPGVAHNPSGQLALALHGASVGEWRVIGLHLPVSYRRAPQETLAVADAWKADAVLGTGVGGGLRLERWAKRVAEGRVDVDGQTLCLLSGPPRVAASWDLSSMAKALGAVPSDDAGAYVCNAWLYAVASRAKVPVAFLHLPPEGLAPERLLSALEGLPSA